MALIMLHIVIWQWNYFEEKIYSQIASEPKNR